MQQIYLSITEAAEHLGINKSDFYKLIADKGGVYTPDRIAGRTARCFHREHLAVVAAAMLGAMTDKEAADIWAARMQTLGRPNRAGELV